MLREVKDFLKRHWPRLRLRTILFGILLFTACLPLLGLIFFRVYENALVQRTESELIMQGAVLAAAYGEALKRASTADGAVGGPPALAGPEIFEPVVPSIDIASDEILPDRPAGQPATHQPAKAALAAGRAVEPVLRQATRTTLASVRIVDEHGTVVAGRSETGLSLAHVKEVATALTGRHVSAVRRKSGYQRRYPLEPLSRAASTRVFYATPVLSEGKVAGAVLLSRSPRSLFKGLYEDAAKLAFAAALLFASILAIAALLSRSITKPVELLIDSTRRVARGELALADAPPTAAVEIQQLFADLEVMAKTIDKRSSYIRNFAAAISHEFKTPLTGIRGAIELLQEHENDMPAAQRAQFLQNVSQDADRLNQLVTRLLQLARADVLLPAGDDVAIGDSFREIARAYDGKGVAFLFSNYDASARAAISRDALDTILSNLINNSLQHGASSISINVNCDGNNIAIGLTDNGPGIADQDRSRIFTPFFTTRRDTGGTGLGLAIARALAEAHGGTLALDDGEAGTRQGNVRSVGASFLLCLREAGGAAA